MHLTKHTDISLRVMMHLAMTPDELVTIRDIAERYAISRHHLVKVVHSLAKKNLINSVQGRAGGISLAVNPDKVTVGEIVRLMEQTLNVVDCDAYQCPLAVNCRLKRGLNRATKAFLDVLDQYTISDLITNKDQLLRLTS